MSPESEIQFMHIDLHVFAKEFQNLFVEKTVLEIIFEK